VRLGPVRTSGLVMVKRRPRRDPQRLSDFGSKMGAGRLGQAASDAAIVTVRWLLSCADAVTWPVWPVGHRIRIEGVRGSTPLSSTPSRQRPDPFGVRPSSSQSPQEAA